VGIGGRRSNREKKRANPRHVAVPHCPIFPTVVRASELSADKGRVGRIAEVPLTGVKRIIEADTDILHFLSVLFFLNPNCIRQNFAQCV